MPTEQSRLPRTAADVAELFASAPNSDTMIDAIALSMILRYGILQPTFSVRESWAGIPLSPEGTELLNASTELERLGASNVRAAMFALLHHHDFLVDLSLTDLPALCRDISDDIISGHIRLPYIFGRELYDRFYDILASEYVAPPSELTPEQTALLLNTTSPGVFQTGTLVVGPLGVTRSSVRRWLPPSNRAYLWHCDDTGCGAPHKVSLASAKHETAAAYAQLQRRANELFGSDSNWHGGAALWTAGLSSTHAVPIVTDLQLPALVAECVMGTERQLLLNSLLRSPKRAALESVLANTKARRSEPLEVTVAALTDVERLQVLLTLSNDDLASALDAVLITRALRLPVSERRRPRHTVPLSSLEMTSEMSMHGTRDIADNIHPLVVLNSLIWSTYSELGNANELNWRLRNTGGRETRSVLAEYLHSTPPKDAIQSLILSSQPVTEAACKALRLDVRHASSAAADLNDILMWKMGFDAQEWSPELEVLRRRLVEMREVLLAIGDIRSEQDRERIRAVGVNLFVGVEHFLETLVAYNCWLLVSDHFVETHFIYDAQQAVNSVADVLGDTISENGMDLTWQKTGGNTLGVTLRYLHRLIESLRQMEGTDRTGLRRPAADIPHFARWPHLVFPFNHTQLWADANPHSLSDYIDALSRIGRYVGQADPAGLRNGVDHYRDEATFPTIERTLAFLTRFEEVLTLCDLGRFYPKAFWWQRTEHDRYRRAVLVLQDYAGRMVTLRRPSPAIGHLPVPTDRPVLIAPGNLLGLPDSELLFIPRERSPYANYWNGYPRRWERSDNVSKGPELAVGEAVSSPTEG